MHVKVSWRRSIQSSPCPRGRLIMFKVVQYCSKMFSAVQTVLQYCSNLFNTVQRCSMLFKLYFNTVQSCSILFKVVQYCSNCTSILYSSTPSKSAEFRKWFDGILQRKLTAAEVAYQHSHMMSYQSIATAYTSMKGPYALTYDTTLS